MFLLHKSVKTVLIFFFLTIFQFSQAQYTEEPYKVDKQKSEFWDKVRFGGGFGLNIGTGFTDITLAPSAIYEVNQYVSLGVGLQGSYIRVNPRGLDLEKYKAYTYGGSFLFLVNPIDELQLSAELEQLRVNVNFDDGYTHNFWNTALFLGAGFRTNNVTVGIRYNVLHKPDNNIYYEAFMPFVRVYF